MDLLKKYGDIIKKESDENPARARNLIRAGLTLKNFAEKHIGTKGLPAPYETLFMTTVDSVLNALGKPEKSVWSNIFGPFEIFQCFGLQGVSVEALATFLAGFGIEDYFIDCAEAEGIAPTLWLISQEFHGRGVFRCTSDSSVCCNNDNCMRRKSFKLQTRIHDERCWTDSAGHTARMVAGG